jgi:phage repressor protein C with HTH and peptisase S24 domain
MDESDLSVRETLAALIAARGDHYGALSRLLGRNPAYIQQFIKRGTPRKLDEADRRTLAVYFGVDESVLGGRARDGSPAPAKGRGASTVVAIPRMELGASAGAGSLDDREQVAGLVGFDEAWLRAMGVRRDSLSIIHVDGESMAPTLCDGDEIMVDGADAANRLRAGIYVLRFQDALMVKRIVPGPRQGLVSILSDNPLFQSWPDVDPAQVVLLGRVIWTGRRLR